MSIVIWAINGTGIGHTIRAVVLARAFIKKDIAVSVVVEHQHQIDYIVANGLEIKTCLCRRPWKDATQQESEPDVREMFSNASLVICDMGTIPKASDFRAVVPAHVPTVFFLRWMTRQCFLERVLRRWDDFDENAFICMAVPFEFMVSYMNGDVPKVPRLFWPPGFMFNGEGASSAIYSPRMPHKHRVAFCCGLGGAHSERGKTELRQALLGSAQVRKVLGSQVRVDAWLGKNNELHSLAVDGEFDQVFCGLGLNHVTFSEYDVVVARPSFNTTLELMQTTAAMVTGEFECDGEWDQHSLASFEQYGVYVVKRLAAESISRAAIALLQGRERLNMNTRFIARRKRTFRLTLGPIIDFCLGRIRNNEFF